MLRKTIRNEDCALLRNKTKRNIAQKQFFVLLIIAFIVINNSQWSYFAHKKQAQYCEKTWFWASDSNKKPQKISFIYGIEFLQQTQIF